MSLSSRRRRARGAPRDRSVASTLPRHGCPHLEFALHALFARLRGRRVCRVHRLVFRLRRKMSLSCARLRRSVSRTPSRSASTAAPHSYLCGRPPRSVPRTTELARCVPRLSRVRARPKPNLQTRARNPCRTSVARDSVTRLSSRPDPQRSRGSCSFPHDSTGHFEPRSVAREHLRSALGHAVSCGTSGSRCDACPSRGCPRDDRIADGERTRAVLPHDSRAARVMSHHLRLPAGDAIISKRMDRAVTRVSSRRGPGCPRPSPARSPVSRSSSATSHDANARRTNRCRPLRPTSAPQHRDAHPTITPSPASSSDERTRCSCVVPRCAQFPARPGLRCAQFPARPVLRLVTSLTARLRRGVSSFSRP